MAAILAATHAVPETTFVRLLRSMAEAGMAGGVADLFAVESLFRLPLGLPIPHTALLPKNQVRAARNVSRFFETHFLELDSLQACLRACEPGRHALAWLAHRDHAALVAQELIGLLGCLLDREPSPRTRARFGGWLRLQARDADAVVAGARGTSGGRNPGRCTPGNRNLATVALADTITRVQLDARIAEIVARLISEIDPAISGYVADVITSWEPAELAPALRSRSDRICNTLAPAAQHLAQAEYLA